MSTRTPALAGTATLISAALALSGCSGSPSGDSTTGTLTIANPSTLATFDPAQVTTGSLDQYLQPVYDTLLRRTPDLELVPMLATEWTYDDALTTLSLELRTGVAFTDGTDFDADAVVANLVRTRDANGPQSASLASVDTVTAVDADTVEVHLTEPDPGLLDALAGTAGSIVSPEALDSDTLSTAPVGTGPFVLDTASTTTGDTYTYTANPDYWDPELVPYDTIVIKTLEDVTARMNAIQSGQVQATMAEIPQIAAAESAGLTVQTQLLNFTGLVIFDREGALVPALGDARVRRAINHAIDGDALLTALRDGRGVVTSQLFGEDSEAFVADLDDEYPFDPARARELLAEAGYADGFDITLPDFSAIFGESLFATVTEQLQAVGITVTLESLPIPDMIGKTMSGGYAVTLNSNFQGTAWQTLSQYVLPTAAFNPFHSTDDTVASLIDTVRTTTGDDQNAAYQKLNEHIVEDAWAAPFFREQGVYLSTDAVEVTLQPQTQVPSIYDFAPAE
ncbi:ABC transporter substrate-binding protein [Microbacterium sp. 18062]|uniref:ABC transporter substrate-binding protein n=1 Tax=Microbacterium sp. 18062 TaxID=2681410 RepID=UPI00135A5980|nr:ABC transporter substrate-binding protein [Microbacterium sp. 18062]